jgi:ligand-binding sensor domain-containing protein
MKAAVRIGAMIFLLGTYGPLYALDPAPKLSQYAHTAWRVQDGTFTGAPTVIAQTKDGFIWIGTRSGLYRFDGSEIQPFAPSAEEPLRSPRIISLLAAGDGSLWIGTGNDLERFGITSRYAGGDLLEDASGAFWLHSDHELFHWSPASAQTIPLPLNPDQVVDGIQSLAFDPGGTLLVGTGDSSRGLGLARIENGVLRPATIPGIDGTTLSVQTLMYDSNHALWIGTLAHGLYRVLGSRVEHFGAIDGLTSDSVNGLFEDAEGDVWVATTGGIDRFRDLRVLTVSTREGLSTDSVNAVVAGHDGTVWFSNWHALDSIRDGVVSTIKSGAGLPGEEGQSLRIAAGAFGWASISSSCCTSTINSHP